MPTSNQYHARPLKKRNNKWTAQRKSNKWVRPQEPAGQQQVNTTATSNVAQPTAADAEATESSVTQPHPRPVLKGPSNKFTASRSWRRDGHKQNSQQKNDNSRPHRTWTRSKEHDESSAIVPSQSQDSAELKGPSNANQNQNDESDSLVRSEPMKWEHETEGLSRDGKNKLVHLHSRATAQENKVESSEPKQQKGGEVEGFKRVGMNKLVHLHSQDKPRQAPVVTDTIHASKPDPETEQSKPKELQPNQQDLKRVGRHKLMTTHAVTQAKTMPATPAPPQFYHSKRKSNHAAVPSDAKRIRISQSAAANEDESLATTSRDEDDGKTTQEEPTVLTTFAYCQPTGSKHGRSNSRARRLQASHSLVRVPTNDTTRICPTFAKGMECDREGCLLRHDVPREAARPTCHHFLNHGMCLKENCPFRHVKGSEEPCPRWSKTGYCTVENCPYAHVQHRNKVLNAKKKGNNHKDDAQQDKEDKLLVFYD